MPRTSGRRVEKTVGMTTAAFLYDGLNPVQELQGGTPSANVLPGLEIDEYFTRTDTAGTRALLTDALGSTVALADDTGTVQTEYTYEPFGATQTSGAPSSNSFHFTGRENDSTGLHYYRARYYHPQFHRFLSEDPLEFEGGDLNLYPYVMNSPLNYTDPTGEMIALPSDCSPRLSGRKPSSFCDPANWDVTPGVVSISGPARVILKEALKRGAHPTPGMIRHFERILEKRGARALEDSLRSIQRTLAEHLEKAVKYQQAGGYISKIVTTIQRNVREIRAIKAILGR